MERFKLKIFLLTLSKDAKMRKLKYVFQLWFLEIQESCSSVFEIKGYVNAL